MPVFRVISSCLISVALVLACIVTMMMMLQPYQVLSHARAEMSPRQRNHRHSRRQVYLFRFVRARL